MDVQNRPDLGARRMSYELPDPQRDEDTTVDCGCRSSATCADHLADVELALPHTPMGAQTRTVAEDEAEAA